MDTTVRNLSHVINRRSPKESQRSPYGPRTQLVTPTLAVGVPTSGAASGLTS